MVAGLVLLAVAVGFLAFHRRHGPIARAPTGAGPAAATPVAPAPAAPGPDEPADTDGAYAVRGTVVVVEEDGRQLTRVSGTLRAGSFGQFPVTDGRWHAPMPEGRRLELVDVLLGDRKAIPDPDTIEIPPDGVVEVRCRWFVPVVLRVVGEDGNDLEDVELADLGGSSHAHWDRIVPDPELVYEAGRSPVTIEGWAGLRWFWIRARDHAWKQFVFWQGDGGERVVRLVRSGTLEARIVPTPDPEALAQLHLRRAGEDVLTWVPDEESGLCRIEGLPPGPLELRATLGWTWWDERVAATAKVEIEPGKTEELTLSLHDTPPLARVDVEGTVLVDEGWGGAGAASIQIHGGSGGTRVAEDGRWSIGWMPPGQHPFTVMPFGLTQVIDVGPEGTKDVRLVIPPPCDVEVHLVDAATGAAVPAREDLSWHLRWEGADARDIREKSEECAEPGVWRFRAAPGTLVVRFETDLQEGRAEVVLKPGKNRIDLKASPRFACDLALKDGRVPVPVFGGIRATALGGDGGIESCEGDFPCRVRFTKSGRYRITLPAIEGYEPIAPIEVETVAGKIPRVEVQLRRR